MDGRCPPHYHHSPWEGGLCIVRDASQSQVYPLSGMLILWPMAHGLVCKVLFALVHRSHSFVL